LRDIVLKQLSKLEPKLIILFGSYAKNNQNENSDLDLAFLSNKKITNWQRWELAQDLAKELNIDVDLVDLDLADDVLRMQIVSTGEILLNKNMDSFLDRCYFNYITLNEDRWEILESYGR